MHTFDSLSQIQRGLKKGIISCAQLVDHYLSNIASNEHLNALIEVYGEEAKMAAINIDAKLKAGNAGVLAGLVVTVKDVISYKDHKVSGASAILTGFEAQFNATAIERILSEDAIIIGRNNCDEFGMGSSNENSAFGHVLNALDNERVPGGSSGGSAVAVQSDMCLVSLGSDTGGSVRQPAAYCGIVGFKPTYSRISRHGLFAYASSFDCIGVLAKNIIDVAKVLEVIAGKDDFDSTASSLPVPRYFNKIDQHNNQYKLAYIKESIESDGLNSDIKKTTYHQLNKLEKEGHIIEAVEFPLLEYLLPTYYILTMAEASSNLSRYDGVKYGYRHPNVNNLEEMYKRSRSEGFGDEVKRRIMLGTFVLSANYYDTYYGKAQKVRRLIRNYTKDLLSNYDFIITPTTSSTAFKIGEKDHNPVSMYLEDIFTVQASVCGLPAISIPVGTNNNLPIGIQIMADDFEEEKLLAFSNYLMKLE